MAKRMKLRASVRRERIDVTTLEELGRGKRTLLLGHYWYTSLTDGRWRAFNEWWDAIDYAIRATESWDPFA